MLVITPKLTNVGASSPKISVSLSLSPSLIATGASLASGYSTYEFALIWDPAVASVDPTSIKLNGNTSTGAYTLFDTVAVGKGTISGAGLRSDTAKFSASAPLLTFDYTQTTLAPVNFSVIKEAYNGVSYLSSSQGSNILQVALDAAGNSVTPPSIDVLPPTITSRNPTQGDTLSSLDSNLSLTFSEKIIKGSGFIQLIDSKQNTVESFDIASSSRVSLVDLVLTIDPTESLAAGATYFLVLSPSNIKDLSGNAFAGVSYSFGTLGSASSNPDKTPPTLTTWSPTEGGTLASLSSDLVATFSESIVKKIGTLELRLGSASGSVVESFDVATSSRVTASGSLLTINPTNDLLPSTTYYVVIPTGGVQDAANNALTNAATLTFITTTSTSGVASVQVPASSSEKLTTAQLNTFFPSVAADLVSQTKLGAGLVTSADLPNGNSLTKIFSGKTSSVNGALQDKATDLSVILPAQVSLDVSGPTYATTLAEGKAYFNGLIEQVFPSSTATAGDKAYKSSLFGGISTLQSYSSAYDLAAARLYSPAGNAGQQSVTLKGSSAVNDLAVVNMHGLSNCTGVVVDQMSAVMAIGPGLLKATGGGPTVLVADVFNQTIVGGIGNDTISGGGGDDLLFGGLGQDTFLLGTAGRVTLEDFASGDVMKFNLFGVKTKAQLAAKLTAVSEDASGITFTIGSDLAITMAGFSSKSVFTDLMFAFGA